MPLTTADVGPIIPPQAILASRNIKQGEMLIPQVLVQWQGTDSTEATWEDWQELLKDFPTLNLEDKVVFNGGGIVTCGRQVEGELDKAKLDKKTNQEFVTASGQMADDPQSKDHQGEVLRRSHRMKESNRRLKGYHGKHVVGTFLSDILTLSLPALLVFFFFLIPFLSQVARCICSHRRL